MSTQPPAIGFMIPVNKQDFLTIQTPSQDPRNICTASGQGTIGAPWYTCENIRLTNTVSAVTARIGDSVTIQVGIQALTTEFSETQSVLNVQAWVCYPNTVAGETDLSLVVPSMQNQPASAVGDYPAGQRLEHELSTGRWILMDIAVVLDADAGRFYGSRHPWRSLLHHCECIRDGQSRFGGAAIYPQQQSSDTD